MILGTLSAVTKCILHLRNPLMLQNLLLLATTGREEIIEDRPIPIHKVLKSV